MENITLILFLLGIESSYIENVEYDAEGEGDTVQFVLIGDEAWRIKTYAMDHDVHIWNIGKMDALELKKIAIENTEKNYGDVIKRRVEVTCQNGIEELKRKLEERGLQTYLEIPKSNAYLFWVSEPDRYETKSKPDQ